MVDTHAGLSPLHGYADRFAEAVEAPDAVRLAEVPFLTQLTLRVAPGGLAARAVEAALGTALPGPNAGARAADLDVLWLGPDEWLVVGPSGEQAAVEARIAAAVEGAHATVVDGSAQRTVIAVGGSAARAVLSKGCPLDLHPRSFGPGRCAQTLLARTGVIVLQRSDEPTYWLFVRSSFAEYLAAWLLDAGAEYRGLPLGGPAG
jgi:sarcosine oxidase subunit gamma